MLTGTTLTDSFVATDRAGNAYTINEYAAEPDGSDVGGRQTFLRTPDGRAVEVTSPGGYRIPTLGLDLELDLEKSVQ